MQDASFLEYYVFDIEKNPLLIIAVTFAVSFITIQIATYLLKWEDSPVVYVPRKSVTKVNYQTISSPFALTLDSCKNRKELSFTLHKDVECVVTAYWHVDLSGLKSTLEQNWDDFTRNIHKLDSFNNGNTWEFNSLSRKEVLHVNVPELPILGPIPRQKFPLVIIIEKSTNESASGLGALVSVVSIPEAEDKDATPTILYQYLKHYSGKLTNLYRLFTSVDHIDSSPEACVICKNETAIITYLPCRHVCTCDSCFAELENCPICRSNIVSAFEISHSKNPNYKTPL